MKHFTLFSLLSIFVFSCNTKTKEPNYSAVKDVANQRIHPGKKLMEANCYVCHSPSAGHDDRIGPPMIDIKNHYMEEGMTKEDFTQAIQNWIKNPTEESAKMKGAVERFGIMPKQAYPETTIQSIAEYLFDNDIEAPEWYNDHYNFGKGKHQGHGKQKMKSKQQQADANDLSYSDRGLNYALATKTVLGKNLMGTIQKKGTVAALEFCSTKAYPLTDSMAQVHNANIKRVTDKPRNQKNLADAFELKQIETFKKQLGNNLEIEPIVTENNNKIHVYYPIVTNDMCLQCHGTPNETIKKETLNRLEHLYPKDKAIGYDINEIRGVWSISFKK